MDVPFFIKRSSRYDPIVAVRFIVLFNTATLGMMVFATAFGGNGASASGSAVAGMRQGYAAAESMVLFVGVLVVTVISQAVMKRMEGDR